MSAIISVQLAQRGIRGAQATFEGIDGFFRVYLRNQYDADVLRDGIGERYAFTALSYKPYPCCRFNHCGIEAALELRKSIQGRIGDIRRIRVGLNRQAYQAVCTPIEIRRSPRTIVQAQFSIPYTVAAALVDGQVGLRHFTDDLAARQDIMALARKVEPYVDEDIEKAFGRNVSPTAIEIELEDGGILSQRIDVPLGHPQRPMSDVDFEAKAIDCFNISARPLPDGAHTSLRNMVSRLESLDDAQALFEIVCSSQLR
jgi:2-methylcitrate dehydratase PrpD